MYRYSTYRIGSVFIFSLVLFVAFGRLAYPQAEFKPPEASDATLSSNPDENDADTMTDIHDIKPPQLLGFNPAYLYYSLLLGAILFICIMALIYWKKRQRQKTDEALNVLLPPEVIALEALNELKKYKNGDGRIFYFGLSAILREYIQGRYKINALEMTSEEFMPLIENLDIDRSCQRDLKDLFRSTDPIKFAASPANEKKMAEDLAFVYEFVNQTTPQEKDV